MIVVPHTSSQAEKMCLGKNMVLTETSYLSRSWSVHVPAGPDSYRGPTSGSDRSRKPLHQHRFPHPGRHRGPRHLRPQLQISQGEPKVLSQPNLQSGANQRLKRAGTQLLEKQKLKASVTPGLWPSYNHSVRSKSARIVRKSQKQRTTGRRRSY